MSSTKMTAAFAVLSASLAVTCCSAQSVHGMSSAEFASPSLSASAQQQSRQAQVCASAGQRSQQCGSTNPSRPQLCCNGLTCKQKTCVGTGIPAETTSTSTTTGGGGTVWDKLQDGNFNLVDEEETDKPTFRPTSSPTKSPTEAAVVDNNKEELQKQLDDVLSDLADLGTNTPAAPVSSENTSSAAGGGGAGTATNVGGIDLLRPTEAVNGLKPAGGIASAVFGDRKTRRWDALIDPTVYDLPDPMQQVQPRSVLMERGPFKFTEMPSAAPSDMPSVSPTDCPSVSPSVSPTDVPSVSPTPYPTITMSPTEWLWVTEPRPASFNSAYFDYDPSSPRGPSRWSQASNTVDEKHWKQWQEYIDDDLGRNVCGNTGSRRQSPIDVRFDKADGQCFEYHEIRHRAGEFSVADPKTKALILPTKLRIDYPYVTLDSDEVRDMGKDRPSWTEIKEEDDGTEGDTVKDAVKGPSADIPKGWGYQLPVTHVDIKIPSEHWMEGKQYAAEYQIFLIQNRKAKRGAPAISVLIDLDPADRDNPALQIVLDRFQDEWDKDEAECENIRRKERRVEAIFDRVLGGRDSAKEQQSTILDEPKEVEEKFQKYLRRAQEAPQGGYKYFDPWDKDHILKSIYFFGYEGSLTEPPCTEFLEWRILDKPMTVSRRQLFQMKKLLFHHRDPEKGCQRTSTHYEGSVARPLQPYNGRLVHRCMCRDYLGDKEGKKLGLQRCPWKDRDQWGFNRNVYTKEWYDRTHAYQNPDHQLCKVWGDCADWNEELASQQTTGVGGWGQPAPAPAGGGGIPWWWSF